jgi:UDP-N-acetylmuramoyl-L-alanyl-D-glutamate--2,6-diaminopimelate ligase
MILSTVTARIPERQIVGDGEVAVARIAYRSDRVAPGDLFCCLRGLSADGHDYAGDAVGRGAAALMVERPLGLGVPEVVVPDRRLGMALAAAELNGRPSEALACVGVTGTNGKTTSAFILNAMLAAAGMPCGLIGTIETRVAGAVEPAGHTTPESSDLQALLRRMRDGGDRACVMEVSSHALVQRRVAGVEFAAALFTNLTRDHLDYHADEQEYFDAKRRLFVRPPGEGTDPPAAVNLDDPFGARLHAEVGGVGYALAGDADVRADWADLRPDGVRARVLTPRGPLRIHSPLRARFNLSNLLGCVAVAEVLELDHGAVSDGIAGLGGVPGRLEAIECGQPFQVLVDYAHTPDSLENVLRAARELAGEGRLGVVFGCGGDRDRGKRGPMGRAVRALADFGVVTSDNPRGEEPDAIIAEILAGSGEGPALIEVEEDRRRAIARALEWASDGDVVVIAGKGHESGQERNGVITPFDDRDVARIQLGGDCA